MHVNIVIYSIVREIIQESLRWTDLDTVHSKRTEGLAVDIILLSGIDIKIGCGCEAIVIVSLSLLPTVNFYYLTSRPCPSKATPTFRVLTCS